MRFGTFHLMGSPEMAPAEQRYEETLDQIVLAEQVGFDSVWIAEHHFSNYGYSTNPFLTIAAASRITSRVRFGQAVIVTPFWHPLRLAEDVAAADILTRGRLELGIGRGYQPLEFRGLEVPFEASRSLFQEAVELMKKAWSETDFTFEGKHYQVASPLTVFPRPLQKPHPPIWVAVQREASLEWALEHGCSVLLSGNATTGGDIGAWSARFHEARRDGMRLGILRHVYVTDTDEQARQAMWQSRWQIRVANHLRRDDHEITAGRNDARPVPDEVDDDAWFDRLVYGTPERCIAQLRRDADMGATDLLGWFDIGGLPGDEVLRSMRRFATEVMPALAGVQS